MQNKLLLFGGAFNPPHKGHERLLKAAIDAVNPDVTVVLPTSTSPHKESGGIDFFHRAAMARSFKKLGNVVISEFEHQGRKSRNYTIQSIKRLQKKYPGYRIYLLIGGDMIESFTTWSRYRRILSLVTLVVAARDPKDRLLQEAVAKMKRLGAEIIVLHFEPLVISSSELRNDIRNGKDVSSYLDSDVANYLKNKNLY